MEIGGCQAPTPFLKLANKTAIKVNFLTPDPVGFFGGTPNPLKFDPRTMYD
jgi:hypothetical protein